MIKINKTKQEVINQLIDDIGDYWANAMSAHEVLEVAGLPIEEEALQLLFRSEQEFNELGEDDPEEVRAENGYEVEQEEIATDTAELIVDFYERNKFVKFTNN